MTRQHTGKFLNNPLVKCGSGRLRWVVCRQQEAVTGISQLEEVLKSPAGKILSSQNHQKLKGKKEMTRAWTWGTETILSLVATLTAVASGKTKQLSLLV